MTKFYCFFSDFSGHKNRIKGGIPFISDYLATDIYLKNVSLFLLIWLPFWAFFLTSSKVKETIIGSLFLIFRSRFLAFLPLDPDNLRFLTIYFDFK